MQDEIAGYTHYVNPNGLKTTLIEQRFAKPSICPIALARGPRLKSYPLVFAQFDERALTAELK
ncbi:MAG: hypothetical protein JXA30_15760 [Deltaproteobacteria bacterium]|nr:hypothetical protein [Deltaproteobacteria bacterium]